MPLPDHPSLEFLKKLAKDRLPEMRRAAPSARLADAQLAVAREHGFPSWRALRAELQRRLAAAEPDPPDPVIQLFTAIRSGEGPVVDRLLAAHPGLANARDEEGSTPLSAAVDAHRAALIPILLARGGDPHLVYAHSAHTPLSWAVVIEAYDCARALMEAGVDVTAVRVLATHHDFAMLNALAGTPACKAAIQLASEKLASALKQ